jgi:formylglycine-generating enzyme required for sulfatase activity
MRALEEAGFLGEDGFRLKDFEEAVRDIRGGCFDRGSWVCRSAHRDKYTSDIRIGSHGLRLLAFQDGK